MRYRLCTVDKDTKRPEFYWHCYTSLDETLYITQAGVEVTRDSLKELSTGNANEHVFDYKNLFIIMLDETHPAFNLNAFPWDEWKYMFAYIPESTLITITKGIGQLILNVVKDL